jgi:hypothetical protein
MASGARDQGRALEDVLYEMLMLASALAFRDIRILGSAESRMGLSTDRPGRYPPQVAPPAGVLSTIQIEGYRHDRR